MHTLSFNYHMINDYFSFSLARDFLSHSGSITSWTFLYSIASSSWIQSFYTTSRAHTILCILETGESHQHLTHCLSDSLWSVWFYSHCLYTKIFLCLSIPVYFSYHSFILFWIRPPSSIKWNFCTSLFLFFGIIFYPVILCTCIRILFLIVNTDYVISILKMLNGHQFFIAYK